jgi:ABC-2 type transport system permease protein
VRLFISEWERLWQRKVTWLVFAAIPAILYASAMYYRKHNQGVSPHLPEYTVFANFPVLGLNEQLMSTCNVVVLILAAYLITEEYTTGQLRMVMIRSYSFSELFLAKLGVLLLALLLFLACYFIGSYAVGYFMFEHTTSVPLFYHNGNVSEWQAFFYTVRYYAVAYAALVAMAGVMVFFAVISRMTTTAMGLGISFLLLSFGYPTVLSYFRPLFHPEVFGRLYFASLPVIQWQGIAMLLAGKPGISLWSSSALGAYALLFGVSAYFLFTRKDRFI